ncbi:MAG: hypothetical protein JNK05_23745 [Myxococcales bacterium]|nr:hypothetical protein [Myxococcales bacterium]
MSLVLSRIHLLLVAASAVSVPTVAFAQSAEPQPSQPEAAPSQPPQPQQPALPPQAEQAPQAPQAPQVQQAPQAQQVVQVVQVQQPTPTIAVAQAQPAVVTALPGPVVSAESVRAQIASEMGAPAVLASPSVASSPLTASSARGTLLIFVSPDGRLTVRWTARSGARLERSVPAPSDPIELVRTIGVLAANLAQDPMSELVSRDPNAPVAPIPPNAPVHVVIALQPGQVIAPSATVAPAPAPVQPQPQAQPQPVQAPIPWPAPQDWRARRAAQRVSFGLESYSTFFAGNAVGFSPSSTGSVFINYHFRPWLRLGVGQITGGALMNGGYASATPYAEFVWDPLQWLEVFGQVGLGLQGQFMGSGPASGLRGARFAMNASATAGVRFRLGHSFSIGVATRGGFDLLGDFAYWHAHNSPTSGGAVVGMGLELGWTLGG